MQISMLEQKTSLSTKLAMEGIHNDHPYVSDVLKIDKEDDNSDLAVDLQLGTDTFVVDSHNINCRVKFKYKSIIEQVCLLKGRWLELLADKIKNHNINLSQESITFNQLVYETYKGRIKK